MILIKKAITAGNDMMKKATDIIKPINIYS